MPSPKNAPFDVLRLCNSERDAVLVSIRISKLSQKEIAARVGVSKQALSKWVREGIPGGRVRAFCNATGTLLVQQYLAMHRAMREASGVRCENDRIGEIAAIAMGEVA
ncbi:helix-turn-helix transcriptional regulator [Pseudoxanthomonas sp. JBR18]|uniref:helix-turn-helix domain-containing protein n=1 Tax=Pseudoxanthomonas sp. JBR18 TaxID=2969308 RepID=UPI0023059F75|nr:helix-turn-helix transcriptional regulator [Pseudoxanthomonas sp. JBR18]WCE04459.1 helix-turn-helix transcriptional regulator [Pseudoxanthomonas sp. JBR18]